MNLCDDKTDDLLALQTECLITTLTALLLLLVFGFAAWTII